MPSLDLLAHLRALLTEEHETRKRIVAARIEVELLRSRAGRIGQGVFVVAFLVLFIALIAFRRAEDLSALTWVLVACLAGATMVGLLVALAKERARARSAPPRPIVASCRRCGPGSVFRLDADAARCAACALALSPEAAGATILALDADCASAWRALFEVERSRLDASLYASLREGYAAYCSRGAQADAASLEVARTLSLCYVPSARRSSVTDWLARYWGEAFPIPLEDLLGPGRAMLYGELRGRPLLVIQTWRAEHLLALQIAAGSALGGLTSETFIVAPGLRYRPEQGRLSAGWKVSAPRAGLFLHCSVPLRAGYPPAEPLLAAVEACHWLSRASAIDPRIAA